MSMKQSKSKRRSNVSNKALKITKHELEKIIYQIYYDKKVKHEDASNANLPSIDEFLSSLAYQLKK